MSLRNVSVLLLLIFVFVCVVSVLLWPRDTRNHFKRKVYSQEFALNIKACIPHCYFQFFDVNYIYAKVQPDFNLSDGMLVNKINKLTGRYRLAVASLYIFRRQDNVHSGAEVNFKIPGASAYAAILTLSDDIYFENSQYCAQTLIVSNKKCKDLVLRGQYFAIVILREHDLFLF